MGERHPTRGTEGRPGTESKRSENKPAPGTTQALDDAMASGPARGGQHSTRWWLREQEHERKQRQTVREGSWKGELRTDYEDQRFSPGHDGVPTEDTKQCLETFLVVTIEHGGNAPGIEQVQPRGFAQHPSRNGPHSTEPQGPECQRC